MSTFGPAYEETLDGDRIRRQHVAIRHLMSDGDWRTLREIALTLEYPEASVSAQLRHLRKPEFGSHSVEKRRRALSGLWEYRVLAPVVTFDTEGQGEFFAAAGTTYGGQH